MKLSDKQKDVIHYMVKYLNEELENGNHTKIYVMRMNNVNVDIKHTILWFRNLWKGNVYNLLPDKLSKERLNIVREYYIDRLKKDIK